MRDRSICLFQQNRLTSSSQNYTGSKYILPGFSVFSPRTDCLLSVVQNIKWIDRGWVQADGRPQAMVKPSLQYSTVNFLPSMCKTKNQINRKLSYHQHCHGIAINTRYVHIYGDKRKPVTTVTGVFSSFITIWGDLQSIMNKATSSPDDRLP